MKLNHILTEIYEQSGICETLKINLFSYFYVFKNWRGKGKGQAFKNQFPQQQF